jgi:hypothetical protein
VVLHGEELRWKIRSQDQLNRRLPRAPEPPMAAVVAEFR